MIDKDEIRHRFAFHPATTEEKKADHGSVRRVLWDAAEEIDRLCPDGREKATAITKLEEVMFWANAAIARTQQGANEGKSVPLNVRPAKYDSPA